MRSQITEPRDKHGSFSVLVARLNTLLETEMPHFQWKGTWYQAKFVAFQDPDVIIETHTQKHGIPVRLFVHKSHSSLGNIVMQIMMSL